MPASPQSVTAKPKDPKRVAAAKLRWPREHANGRVPIVGGKPTVGKRTLVFAAAVACASDVASSFLGRTIWGGPVVIATEEHATTARAKLPDLDDLRVLTREHAWPKPSMEELIN